MVLKIAKVLGIVISKIVLFLAIFTIAARLIDASTFISYDKSAHFGEWLHGYRAPENYDDLWFVVNAGLSMISAVVSYNIVMWVIRKVRQ